MITYKNISYSAKTFYGIKFGPGEIKSVPGYITSPVMVRIFEAKSTSPDKVTNPVPVVSRGRKKKSIDAEKESIAEQEVKITETIPEEETTDGNPS